MVLLIQHQIISEIFIVCLLAVVLEEVMDVRCLSGARRGGHSTISRMSNAPYWTGSRVSCQNQYNVSIYLLRNTESTLLLLGRRTAAAVPHGHRTVPGRAGHRSDLHNIISHGSHSHISLHSSLISFEVLGTFTRYKV